MKKQHPRACIVVPIQLLAQLMPTLPILVPMSAYMPMYDAYLSNCSIYPALRHVVLLWQYWMKAARSTGCRLLAAHRQV